MIGETRDVLVGIVAAEMIEHQKRIEMLQAWGTDRAMDGYASAFCERRGLNELLYMSSDHCFIFNPIGFR